MLQTETVAESKDEPQAARGQLGSSPESWTVHYSPQKGSHPAALPEVAANQQDTVKLAFTTIAPDHSLGRPLTFNSHCFTMTSEFRFTDAMQVEIRRLLEPSIAACVQQESASRLLGALYVSELKKCWEGSSHGDWLDLCDTDTMYDLLEETIKTFNDLRRCLGDPRTDIGLNIIVTDGSCVIAARVNGLSASASPGLYYSQNQTQGIKTIYQGIQGAEAEMKLLPAAKGLLIYDYGADVDEINLAI